MAMLFTSFKGDIAFLDANVTIGSGGTLSQMYRDTPWRVFANTGNMQDIFRILDKRLVDGNETIHESNICMPTVSAEPHAVLYNAETHSVVLVHIADKNGEFILIENHPDINFVWKVDNYTPDLNIYLMYADDIDELVKAISVELGTSPDGFEIKRANKGS